MNNKRLNVVYSSDDNYAQHLGASLYSLLQHNTEYKNIYVYIIDNNISSENKYRLQMIADAFTNAKVVFISFGKWSSLLNLNMMWPISLSAYARLFLGSIIEETVERILYLDCDTIVCDSLTELWETDLDKNIIAAVQDTVNEQTKNGVGISKEETYFNSGVLLIDLAKWRANGIEEKMLKFIDDHKGQVVHHDQGVINGVLHHSIARLPVRYNVMTIHYMMNYKKVMKYTDEESEYYTKNEVMDAKLNPAIVHFTPSFTSHPWNKDCLHPKKSLYWDSLKNTPWKDAQYIRDNTKWYVKLINWRYRKLPF